MKKLLKQIKGNGLGAQLFKGATGSAGLQSLNLLLTFVIGVLIARSLGPINYGIYAYVLSVITLLSLPVVAGLPTLVVRETAKNHLKNDWNRLRGLLMASNKFVFVFSFIIVIFSALVTLSSIIELEPQKFTTFMWSLLLIPLMAFNTVRGAMLRGLQRVVIGQLPEMLVRPFAMIVLFYGCIHMNWDITPISVMQINVVSVVIAFLLGVVLLAKFLPKEVHQASSTYETKAWTKSLLPLSLFAGLSIANSQLSTVILGVLGNNEDVGLFRVAIAGASLITFGLTAVNMVLAPHITRLYHSGEIELLQKIITKSVQLVLLVSLPVSFVFIVYGDNVIKFIFGVDYVGAALSLAILSVGQLVNASAGSVALILNMTGNEKETVKGIVIALILNVGISLALVPFYGAIGAAVASTISMAVWNIMLIIKTYQITGIVSTFFRPTWETKSV